MTERSRRVEYDSARSEGTAKAAGTHNSRQEKESVSCVQGDMKDLKD
jgi:hypothetical protein